MPSRAVGGLALNECAKCHGLWVPEGRLDSLVERALAARERRAPLGFTTKQPREIARKAPASLLAYRRCPVCEAFMLRQNYERRSGIIIDVCRAHGTWLDADELEAIGAFILSGGLVEARAKEAESARDEQRRRREQKVQLALLSQRVSSRGQRSPEEAPAHGWVLELLRQLFS
jgi:Zn-finger nucleic acid-binding protein